MDSLIKLMSLIDLNSQSLPDGQYLEACNYMKDIYKHVPKPTSPGMLPRTVNPIHHDERLNDFNEIQRQINSTSREIRAIESRLKYLRTRQRITQSIKTDAIRERAQQLGIRLRVCTMEELRAKGHIIPDERSFYKSYLERHNLIVMDIIRDIRGDLGILNEHLQNLTIQRDELHALLHGRQYAG